MSAAGGFNARPLGPRSSRCNAAGVVPPSKLGLVGAAMAERALHHIALYDKRVEFFERFCNCQPCELRFAAA